MTQQTIEVEGLPEGWEAVAYRPPIQYKDHIFLHGEVSICDFHTDYEHLILEKIQPRRIVLEETDEIRRGMQWEWCEDIDDGEMFKCKRDEGTDYDVKIWREVKE